MIMMTKEYFIAQIVENTRECGSSQWRNFKSWASLQETVPPFMITRSICCCIRIPFALYLAQLSKHYIDFYTPCSMKRTTYFRL